MSFSSINIQGNIVSSEILDKIRNEDIKYQTPADFALPKNTSVRDEVGIAWAAARAHYTAFKLRVERLSESETGTSETRNSWILPLLRELGYDVEKASAFIHPDTQKSYAISHKVANRGDFPVHIMGIRDNLDSRRDAGGPRLSPHSLMQEYLNHTEHTYGIVTNGQFLRVLRDATRLVRISFLEFDLVKIMEDELYSDFAVLYRLLHVTRLPKSASENEESILEYYHQESLSSGSRIREALSLAVEKSIKLLANGFLRHSSNEELRENINRGFLSPQGYYKTQLRLIYRILFLAVTEERNLVYAETNDPEMQRRRKLYYEYYSIERLRKLAGRLQYMDGNKHDLWEGLKATFLLFENGFYGKRLGIEPLGSGLFSPTALNEIINQRLSNEILLKVIRNLTYFENKNKQWVRVNYSDLDVEEFGSVYEGLLELEPYFTEVSGRKTFEFKAGNERSKAGAHYTPEELVKPLIKHSLEYIIEDKLKEADPERALLSITVCDVACGSGHILLSAARRIALQLAILRETKATEGKTIVEQPSPAFVRTAMRDVIRHCIYGVDKNEMAVELCKVALWLEAHVPGEPLNFLDHRIKWGDSIVGLAHKEELKKGISDEAFKALPGDEKEIAQAFAKQNKQERKTRDQVTMNFEQQVEDKLSDVFKEFDTWSQLPEQTPEQVEAKSAAYRKLIRGSAFERIRTLADIQVGQFFIPKTTANKDKLVTDGKFNQMLRGVQNIPAAVMTSIIELSEKRFFHWFIEFPEVFGRGGFDCILGNPPFLGGQALSGSFGNEYLNNIKAHYRTEGSCDLVTYFFRRIFQLLIDSGFMSLISTNSISQGVARENGLDVILNNGGVINFTIRSAKWPGKAAVFVTLISIRKGVWAKASTLDYRSVKAINSFLSDSEINQTSKVLIQNSQKSFMGSTLLGMGFTLTPNEAKSIIKQDIRYSEVLFPFLSGENLYNSPNQLPERWVINFSNMPLKRAALSEWEKASFEEKQILIRNGIVEPNYSDRVAYDYPICIEIVERLVMPERLKANRDAYREKWWHYAEKRPGLYHAVNGLSRVLLVAQTSKTAAFSFVQGNQVYAIGTITFAFDDFRTFSILQSTPHNLWSWKYGSTMKTDLRYSPSDIFETYPFPQNLNPRQERNLETIGESYHEHRRKLMLGMQLGLTKTYNLFHSNAITSIEVNEKDKQVAALQKHLEKTPDTISFTDAIQGILKLRELHVQMDEAVLEAYGWAADSADGPAIQLRHDFYEVDYLPENDRIRFTIHPDARKEVLKRLLALNHKIHEEEVKAGLWERKKTTGKKKITKTTSSEVKEPQAGYGDLFNEDDEV